MDGLVEGAFVIVNPEADRDVNPDNVICVLLMDTTVIVPPYATVT
jgi:hypothetical protein